MSFTSLWDSTYESLPDNNTYGYLIDDYFRMLYVAIRERMQVDHQWMNGQLDGQHKQVTLLKLTVKPTAVATYGFVYTKDVGSGVIELFFEDAAGNELQLTSAGKFNPQYAFPAGTKSIFYQDVAPTGWTIQNTLDDKLLFITKGSTAGGQTGGGAHSTGSWTISGLAGNSHTLTATEMPAHTHTMGRVCGGTGGLQFSGGGGMADITPSTGSAGSGGGHTHTVTHTPAWRPAAYCAIIASKN